MAIRADGEVEPLRFEFDRLVLAGWAGRDKESVYAHIEELKRLGIPPPPKVPCFFHVGANLLTTERTVRVLESRNNGEVEYVLLLEGGRPKYVTVGSDHTDRDMERESFLLSKQLCPKVIPPIVWVYDEVIDHWDDLILRMSVDGKISQESPLKSLLKPQDLVREAGLGDCNAILFSGSIPWIGGEMAFGRRYRIELEDPIFRRKISYTYETVKA